MSLFSCKTYRKINCVLKSGEKNIKTTFFSVDGEMKDCKTLKDNYDDCRFVTARYDEEACVSFHNI